MIEFEIDELVPHSRTMLLLDQIIHCEGESLQAEVTIRPDSLFATPQGVPSYIGVEYMAQAIAAWAGVQDRRQGRDISIGFLVGTRRYRCNKGFFPQGSRLTVYIQRELQGANGLGVFDCQITTNGIEARANLNVFQPEDVDTFLEQESAKAKV